MVIQYRCGNCKGRILDKHKYSFLCIPCLSRELPFGNENDNTFYTTNSLGSNTYSNLENYEISLSKTVQQQIKNITQLILANTDPDNANSNFCNYYSVKKFTKNNFKNNFSIFHLNIAPLQLHIDDLTLLLNSL